MRLRRRSLKENLLPRLGFLSTELLPVGSRRPQSTSGKGTAWLLPLPGWGSRWDSQGTLGMSGCPCFAVLREVPGQHPACTRAALSIPALAQLGGPLPPLGHGSRGSSDEACGCPTFPWAPTVRGGYHRCRLQVLQPAPQTWVPMAPPVWGLWSPHGKGLVCPVEDAQHPAQLRLHWHLPFIGCGGSRSWGAGPTLPLGVVLRGGSPGGTRGVLGRVGCSERLGDGSQGCAQPAACPGDGAAVPALPNHLCRGRAGCSGHLPARRASSCPGSSFPVLRGRCPVHQL